MGFEAIGTKVFGRWRLQSKLCSAGSSPVILAFWAECIPIMALRRTDRAFSPRYPQCADTPNYCELGYRKDYKVFRGGECAQSGQRL